MIGELPDPLQTARAILEGAQPRQCCVECGAPVGAKGRCAVCSFFLAEQDDQPVAVGTVTLDQEAFGRALEAFEAEYQRALAARSHDDGRQAHDDAVQEALEMALLTYSEAGR